MPINILMPALSPTMTEGTLAKWHAKEGGTVKAGDVLAEIETDKATMEVEAVDEGTLGRIYVSEGTEGVPVNQVIAVLLEEGESADVLPAAAPDGPKAAAGDGKAAPQEPAPPQGGSATATPLAARIAAQANLDLFGVAGSGPQGRIVKADVEAALAGSTTSGPRAGDGADRSGRITVSPLARKMAQQAALDLSRVQGSGPEGRIVKRDIEAALEAGTAKMATPPMAPSGAPAAATAGPSARKLADMLGMEYEVQSLSNMRRTIARRLTEAKQQVPHFYLTVDCEIDELLRVRKQINERFTDLKISVNDFVIRAVALALKEVPTANASYDESGLLFYKHADVSVAVATPNGLITPIVKRAETKGLAAISQEMKDLATRARDGKLKPEEYQGGTFSVSNLGMYGVREFAAIINPPQGCILAVGAGEQRAVVRNGGLVVATVMSCTLSVDHRVVDGAVGAEFLAAFKKYVEYPPGMLL